MSDIEKNNLKGISFMLAACLIATFSAILIKNIGQNLNSFVVVLIRCGFTVMITLSFNIHLGRKLFATKNPTMMTVRSLLSSIVILGNFYAISTLPLVQVTALQFSKPLFLIILAAVFLGERIRLKRTTATLLGFIGILIVLHPWDNINENSFHPAHLAVLTAALAMAGTAIFSKILTRTHNPTTMVLYSNLAGFMICFIPALYFWKTPTIDEFVLIALMGVTTFCAQYCMISSYKYAEVTVATPFEYSRIIFAAIAGFMIFSEIPDKWTIIGGIIICTSTLFIAFREAHIRKQSI